MLSADLLRLLSDGQARTGAELTAATGIASDQLTQALDGLRDAGLSLAETADGRIALGRPIEWLDHERVTAAINDSARQHVERIHCLFEHESTNRFLLEAGAPPRGLTRVAIAEYQHAGRGRRGRRWIMPPGSGIALSAAWQFAQDPKVLSAFSLATGAVARRAIHDVTGIEVGLKWPNDLYLDGGKLGGILVELDPLPGDTCHVIAGIGINVDLPEAQRAVVGEQAAGVKDLAGAAAVPDRAELAGALIARLVELFTGFEATGFDAYRDEWSAAHILDGEEVVVHTPARTEFGIVRGIEADGALIVEDDAGQRLRHTAGDVTVRVNA